MTIVGITAPFETWFGVWLVSLLVIGGLVLAGAVRLTRSRRFARLRADLVDLGHPATIPPKHRRGGRRQGPGPAKGGVDAGRPSAGVDTTDRRPARAA
ncbi:hypothetical protein [Saccharothrix lopnurensis]|uniref:LPXTG-motif cell wall-anchored protein n=1 Tax=Saccharothrix lopnurensis TaxID=1670621 RepID=A0ABW1P727_9PSEU